MSDRNIFEMLDLMFAEAVINARTPEHRKRAEITRDVCQAVLKHMNDSSLLVAQGEGVTAHMGNLVKAAAACLGLVVAMVTAGAKEPRMEMYEAILVDADDFVELYVRMTRDLVQRAADNGQQAAVEALAFMDGVRGKKH